MTKHANMSLEQNITAELYTTENGSTMSEVAYKPNTLIEWIADDLRDNYDGWDYAILTGPNDEDMGTIINPKWDGGNIVAVLIEGGSDGYDELVAYDLNAHKYVDDDGNLVDDDCMPEYDAHRFVTVDYHDPLGFDVEDEAEWLEYAGNECGLVFEPGIVFDKVAPSYYHIAGRR